MTNMNTGAPARPTLLTVLCVLSFLGAALGIFGGLKNVLSGGDSAELAEAQAKLEEARGQMGDEAAGMMGGMMDGAMEMAQKTAENARPMGIANVLLALISLFGVWKMWNLQKQGFWFYLVATIGGLIVPLVFLGANMVALMTVGAVGFISLVFVVLYATQLKHMA
jgi:hypothetical protein